MGSIGKWRKFFEGAEGDIWSVIEAAISVAASDCPHELRNRRDKILHKLFTFPSAAAKYESLGLASSEEEDHSENGCSEEDHSEKEKKEDHSENGCSEEDHSKIAEDRKDGIHHVNCKYFQECKADEKSLREKVEASKKRAQQGYQQAEEAKKQRAIQIIELRSDLPTQHGSPVPASNITLKTSSDTSPNGGLM